jgi:hypothetical protein
MDRVVGRAMGDWCVESDYEESPRIPFLHRITSSYLYFCAPTL